jgi:hypothetical protein
VPDDFFMTTEVFTATSGQTVFTPTARNVDYIAGQDLIFVNGALMSLSDYTETTTTFTFGTGLVTGDTVTSISMRAKANGKFYADTSLVVESVSGSNVVWNAAQMPFQNMQHTTKEITE